MGMLILIPGQTYFVALFLEHNRLRAHSLGTGENGLFAVALRYQYRSKIADYSNFFSNCVARFLLSSLRGHTVLTYRIFWMDTLAFTGLQGSSSFFRSAS